MTVSANGYASRRQQILHAETPPEHDVEVEGIAPALINISRWIPWAWHRDRDKWTKIPVDHRGFPHDAHDPSLWMTFPTATRLTRSGRFGLGFVFNEDGNCGIDLDDCRNPDTGEIKPWAQRIIDLAATYTEISPSGTGVKLFLRGTLPEKFSNEYERPDGDGEAEIYSTKRFFTVTGKRLPGTPDDVAERPAELMAILRIFESWKLPKRENLRDVDTTGFEPSDDIETARAALNALDPSTHYWDWLSIGMALHSVSQSLLPDWEAWSRGCKDKYVEGECERKWKSFGDGDIRIGTLCYLADKTGLKWRPEKPKVADAETTAERVDTARKIKTPDPGPLPPKLLEVPGLVGAVLTYNLATAFKPQPEIGLAAALALQAVLAARRIQDDRGTRTNLQLLGICGSGGGKEYGRQLNDKILTQAGFSELIGPEDIASDSGLLRHVELHPASLVQLDEIGKFLESMRNPKAGSWLKGIMALLLKLFSKASGVYHGKAYADESKTVVIDQPCLVVYGTTVIDSFVAGLTTEAITDGYLARQLVFEASNDDPEEQFVCQSDPPEAIIQQAATWSDVARIGGNLINQHPVPIVVQRESRAQEILMDLNNRARSRRKERTGPQATLWTRTVEKAAQLALVFAASRGPDEMVIDEAAMQWAAGMSWYLTERMEWLAYEYITENEYENSCRRVLRTIRDAGDNGLTTTELHLLTRWLKTKERQDILQALIDRGELVPGKRESTGGRPAEVFKASEFFTSLHGS